MWCKNKYKFIPLTSNNSNIDIVVFKNICKIFWNESPIVHFSFYYKSYEVYTVKKCQLEKCQRGKRNTVYNYISFKILFITIHLKND